MGAMLAREPAASAFVPGDHATTFGGSALPAAAAVAVLNAIQEDGLMQNAQTMGEYFIARLNELQKSQPVIKEVRGKGLMIGIELSKPVAPAIKQACLERGVLLLTVGDTILRLLPAIVISKAQIDRGMEAIADAMASVSGSIQLCV
jgi:acetylornithine aminotransferase/acetylornithine/N-succinyldiaminopimelate aminotransferase